MDFWHLMIKKDDYILKFIDVCLVSKYRLCHFFDKKSKKIEHISESFFLVLNGPSIKEQDLTVLKSVDVAFVNRGFNHSQYSQLKPKYHFFVDPKMIKGIWSMEWLDSIVEMNPDVVFVMPEIWQSNELVKMYIKKGYNFYWLPFNGKCNCIGVSGAAFDFAIKMGYKNIFFTGFEATGLASELLKTNSHFYGVNEENMTKTCYNYEQDLYMMSRQLHDLQLFSKKCRKRGIRVYNCTKGGILDMFERKKL